MKINVEQVKAFFGYVCGAVFAITLLSGFVYAIFGKLIVSEIFVRNAKFESVEFDVGFYHASVYPASKSTVDDWVPVRDCHLAKGSTLELVHTETTEYSLFRTNETSYYFVDQHGRKSSFAKGCPADKFYLRGDRDAIRKDLLNSAKRETSWMELIEHSQETENSEQALRNEHPPASKKVSDGK